MRTLRRCVPVPVSILLALVLAACGGSAPGAPGGTIDLRWADTAGTRHFRAPGLARWCGATRVLEVTAIEGDSGLGLAVLPARGLVAESIAVRPTPGATDSARADSARFEAMRADTVRPQARIAVRWGTRLLLQSYATADGWVRLSRVAPGALDGRFGGTLASRNGTGALAVTGELSGVPLVRADSACDTAFGDPAR